MNKQLELLDKLTEGFTVDKDDSNEDKINETSVPIEPVTPTINLKRKPVKSVAQRIKDQSPGKVDPLSFSEFQGRVKSFTPKYWFAKPLTMSPLLCASYGWRCIDIDLVECELCGKTVKACNDDAFMQSLQSSAHAPYCGWRNNSCPTSFTTISESYKKKLEQDNVHCFQQQLQALRSSSLKLVDTANQTQTHQHQHESDESDQQQPDLLQDAKLLCDHGWSAVHPTDVNGPLHVYCAHCQVTWRFSEPDHTVFYVDRCHRPFCPWLVPTPTAVVKAHPTDQQPQDVISSSKSYLNDIRKVLNKI